MIEIAGCWYQNAKFDQGAKIKFAEEKQMFYVRASNVAFAVCTKPLNMIKRLGGGKYRHEKTVLYTVIDWHEGVRGTENLIFGMGAETDKDCQEMLERLTDGESEVSHRNRVKLNIEKVILKEK